MVHCGVEVLRLITSPHTDATRLTHHHLILRVIF